MSEVGHGVIGSVGVLVNVPPYQGLLTLSYLAALHTGH